MESNKAKIRYLTDEYIYMLTGENVITTYKDTNERVEFSLRAIKGGVYDPDIFGSCFSNSCNCGRTRKLGVPCPECGSRRLSPNEAWTRYGRFDLPFYYCNELRKKNLIKYLSNNFNFKIEIAEPDNSKNKNYVESLFDFGQWNYNKDTKELVLTDTVSDLEYTSYDGLMLIINEFFHDKLSTYLSYVNKSIIVIPIIARAPFYSRINNQIKLNNSNITAAYQAIIYSCTDLYQKLSEFNTELDKSMYLACIRKLIDKNLNLINGLLRASKANLARQLQSHRLENSGRCTIVPDPRLKIDEVAIPRHLAYEAFGGEFIKWLENNKEMTRNEARDIYYNKPNTKETQDLFEEYVKTANDGKGKYVIINRNPSLYELSTQCCRVVLTNNYTMGLPMLVCVSFNADFDGDTMSFYAVPDELTNEIVESMSPKNLIYFKKDQSYIYTPTHEIMMGIMLGCRVNPQSGDLMTFANYDEAYQYKRKHRDFKWQTPCIINEKLTTLGRTKFGEIFQTDIDALLNGFSGEDLTKKYIPVLYEKIANLEDRPERLQQAQELALNISTLSGASAPKLSELYADLDKSYLEKIKNVENDDTLSEDQKYMMVDNIYNQFIKDTENGKDEKGNSRINVEVKRVVTDSQRAKLNQLLDIITYRRNVTPSKELHISNTTLLEGMTPEDYSYLAIENRATQDIKQSAVPKSGYLTRQLVYIGSAYVIGEGVDTDNKGLEIDARRALGRTLLDGTVVDTSMASKPGTLKVRSCVTSGLKGDNILTKDMLTVQQKWNIGDNVGISLLSSMTEMLTQSGLALKHGGSLFQVDQNSKLIAPFDCTIEVEDEFVLLREIDSTRVAKYPKCVNFTINKVNGNLYKKGDVVAWSFYAYTPAYRLDSVIKLMGAKPASSQKKYANNKVLVTECYAYKKGVISYGISKGVPTVKVGDISYRYNPQALYFLPEGTEVQQGQRFCTGVLDLDAASHSGLSYTDVYQLFSNQYYELFPNIQSEIIEFLYTIIVRCNSGKITRYTVNNAVAQSPSIYTRLSFEQSVKTLKSIDRSGIEFYDDALTHYLFPAIFNLDIE